MLIKEKLNPVKCIAITRMFFITLFCVMSIQIASAQEVSSENIDVPFAIIEKSPVYPGCNENGASNELKQCFTQKITEFVAKEFNAKIGKENNLKGLQKVWVKFKIDKKGNVADVSVRASHESLVKEAKRVMSLLPKMKPGIHKGKPVSVPYALPIQFKNQEKS